MLSDDAFHVSSNKMLDVVLQDQGDYGFLYDCV